MRFDSDPRVCATFVGPFCWPLLLAPFVGPFCWPLVWWVLKGVSTSCQMKVLFCLNPSRNFRSDSFIPLGPAARGPAALGPAARGPATAAA